jgi:hypothetical protein
VTIDTVAPMRPLLLVIGLSVGTLLPTVSGFAQTPASPAAAKPRQPYEGVWASNRKACRDQDGVDRMAIQGNRLFWYETRCRASDIKADGTQSWAMRLSCEGEGERLQTRSRISLLAHDKLVMDDSPVGPTKRQTYVRCDGARLQ